MKRSVLAVLAWVMFAAGVLPTLAHASIFRVGTGPGCTHASVPAALGAAFDNPGPDTIRVSRSLSYREQQILIRDQEVQIEGGYVSCGSGSAGVARTTINGAGGLRSSVFTIENATVILTGLSIVGGDSNDRGGGIAIASTVSARVTLRNTRVSGNSAVDGGGISVSGNRSRLELDTDSMVEFNTASRNGGGVHCQSHAAVYILGKRSGLNGNQAQYGGGVHATDCWMSVASNSRIGDGDTISENVAADSGGGLHATRSFMTMYTTDANAPVGFARNRAGRYGGALFAIDSEIEMSESVIDGNSATAGGGAGWLEARDQDSKYYFWAANGDHWEGGVDCADARKCNRISNNIARDANFVDQDGAAFLLVSNSGPATRELEAHIDYASLVGNRGRTLVRSLVTNQVELTLDIRGSEVRGNHVAGSLIELTAPPRLAHPDRAALVLVTSTVAENTIGGVSVLHTQRNARIARNILWQPDRTLLTLDASGFAPPEAEHTLASDLQGFAPSPTALIANPRFIDAAGGNLRLLPDSPAIDYAPSYGARDQDRLSRTVDFPSIPNRYGAMDAGAFERQIVICCAQFGGN